VGFISHVDKELDGGSEGGRAGGREETRGEEKKKGGGGGEERERDRKNTVLVDMTMEVRDRPVTRDITLLYCSYYY
jgi:hypothetical protein